MKKKMKSIVFVLWTTPVCAHMHCQLAFFLLFLSFGQNGFGVLSNLETINQKNTTYASKFWWCDFCCHLRFGLRSKSTNNWLNKKSNHLRFRLRSKSTNNWLNKKFNLVHNISCCSSSLSPYVLDHWGSRTFIATRLNKFQFIGLYLYFVLVI